METRVQMWQRLRSLRAEPPELAAKGARRELFSAALEQSEQLLRGAEDLGPATRPINIFYGLSQGGRALAAALSHENDGRLNGHGITTKDKDGLGKPFAEIRLVGNGKPEASFTTMARLRGASSLTEPTRLGDLVGSLPLTSPGHPSWRDRPTGLVVFPLDRNTAASGVISPKVFAHTFPWPDVDELRSDDVTIRRAWAVRYLNDNYPTLRDLYPMPEEYPSSPHDGDGRRVTLRLDLDNGTGSDVVRRQALYSRTQRVGDQYVASPCIAPDAGPSDPFVALWAVLWACSMLARYEPVGWSHLLDVDSSPDAAGLEELLNDALELIPWFLLDTLGRLPG